MSVDVYWRLPLQGDGRAQSRAAWHRGDYAPEHRSPHPYARTGNPRDGYTYYDYLSQVAGAAELARFDGVWLPYTAGGEDPLIVAGALAREAPRLRFVSSLFAPLYAPVYAAKIANSFQRLSGDRLAWNLVTEEDGDGAPAWHGRRWPASEQLARTRELLDVARGFWAEGKLSYKGQFYEVENGGFPPALQGAKFPRVYTGGTSAEALDLAAAHADVHLLPLEPLEETRRRIAALGARAAALGRTLAYGLEASVTARHAAEAASAELRRREAPIGFAGSYAEVADQIADYARAGVSTFVLSAYPHLEEAYLVGERVLPLVRARVAADETTAARAA